ncbi:LOW QUALITY PROTEIN: hypothetical protein HID58_023488 [Brassica napus]|uniref:Uncharacterized protein n=1 Tax=Brassica napus TaxID=3708 RepID=A0ABQ8D4M6_BRANA|nr:LOW QUALITY PROTEIN: hypothetical protein HID58_023488 [Brassica napus]
MEDVYRYQKENQRGRELYMSDYRTTQSITRCGGVAYAADQEEDKEEEDQEEIVAIELKKECIRPLFERANSYYKDSAPEIPRRKKTTTREDGSTEYILQFIYHFSSLISFDFDDRRLNVNILLESLAEYIDYLYPEESQTTNLKILEAAYKWKKQKLAASEEDYDYYQTFRVLT